MLQSPKQRRKGHQAMAEKVGRFCVVSICTDICKHICCSLCQRNHCLEAALHHRTRQQDCFTLICCRATAEEVFQTKFLASRLYTVACLGMTVLNPENFMHCCGYWDCYISSRVDYQLHCLMLCSKQTQLMSFNAAGAAVGEATVTLHGLQLQVARGELLGICGEVRSGMPPFVVHCQLRV